MTIETYEFKAHFEKFLKLVKKEDIYIARNGKVVAKLTNPYHIRTDTPDALPDKRLIGENFEIPADVILR